MVMEGTIYDGGLAYGRWAGVNPHADQHLNCSVEDPASATHRMTTLWISMVPVCAQRCQRVGQAASRIRRYWLEGLDPNWSAGDRLYFPQARTVVAEHELHESLQIFRTIGIGT